MALLAAIAAGGAAGALLRFGISHLLQQRLTTAFPWGTFLANMLGCLALGFCYIWLTDRAGPVLRLGVTVGLLGALTTFSTYSLESLNLLADRQYALALLNLIGSVVLGLLAAWVGMVAARALFTP